MKGRLHLHLLITLFIAPIVTQAQVTLSWSQRIGTTGSEFSAGVVADNSGNCYVTGNRDGASLDIITTKYNASGVAQWASVYNSGGFDLASDIARDANGNIYVTGYQRLSSSMDRLLTIKYNSSGAQQWASVFSSTASTRGKAVTTDASGNVYATGYSSSGSNTADYLVVKYNSAGVQQWARTFNGPYNGMDIPKEIGVDASGNVYVTGYTGAAEPFPSVTDITTIKYLPSGTQSWVRTFNGAANKTDLAEGMVVEANGNTIITGTTKNAASKNNLIVIKYDASGNTTWTYIDPTAESEGNAITTDASGNYLIAGTLYNTSGEPNVYALKLSHSKVKLWGTVQPSSTYYHGVGIATDNYSHAYVTATHIAQSTTPGSNFYTLKFNSSNGAVAWAVSYDGPGNDADNSRYIAVYSPPSSPTNYPVVFVSGSSVGAGTSLDIATLKYTQSSVVCCAAQSVVDSSTVLQFSAGNFPNPFRGATNIEYTLPEESSVLIRMYSVTGQQVAVISEGKKAAGIHRKMFSAAPLAAGVYHYTITAQTLKGKQNLTKQMVVR